MSPKRYLPLFLLNRAKKNTPVLPVTLLGAVELSKCSDGSRKKFENTGVDDRKVLCVVGLKNLNVRDTKSNKF